MFRKDGFHSGSLKSEELRSTIAVVRSDLSVDISITKHRDKAQIIASILEVQGLQGRKAPINHFCHKLLT